MNAERLHALAIAIQKDILTTDVEASLTSLMTALQALSGSPGSATHQQQVVNLRTAVIAALRQAGSNTWEPMWRQTIEDLGIEDTLGAHLAGRIESTFATNELTPAVAAQELGKLLAEVQGLRAAAEQLLSGLRYFEIGSDDLAPGQCEVGILVPRAFVNNRLASLGEEFESLSQLLAPFEELATGSRGGFEVRAIASSEFNYSSRRPPRSAHASR